VTTWTAKYNIFSYDSILVFFGHDETRCAHHPSALAATMKSSSVLTKTAKLEQKKRFNKIGDNDRITYTV